MHIAAAAPCICNLIWNLTHLFKIKEIDERLFRDFSGFEHTFLITHCYNVDINRLLFVDFSKNLYIAIWLAN